MIENTGRPPLYPSIEQFQEQTVIDGRKITFYDGSTLVADIIAVLQGSIKSLAIRASAGYGIGLTQNSTYILDGIGIVPQAGKNLDIILDPTSAIVVNGIYLNFGSTGGTNGYGIRDSSGTMQVKNSGGSWAAIASGGLNNVVEDLTPQLGGDLDSNGKTIYVAYGGANKGAIYAGSTSAIILALSNIDLLLQVDATGTGKIKLHGDIFADVTNSYKIGDSTHLFTEGHLGKIYLYDGTTSVGILDATSIGVLISSVSNQDITLDAGTGDILVTADPDTALGIATKGYVDKTQSDVTASRAIGTNYQNTTGKDMMVAVACIDINVTWGMGAFTGSSSPPTVQVGLTAPVSGSTFVNTLTFLVPVGWYYKVNATGATLSSWIEWS